MHTPRTLTAIVAGMLLLAACSPDGEETDDIDLGDAADQQEASDQTDQTDQTDAEQADTDTADTEDTEDTDPAEDTPAEDADRADGVVDLTEAIPGTWPVSDAGTVTFAIVDNALVLDDVTANDGWTVDIDEQDPDQIEVDYLRDNTAWKIEIELEDGGSILEIEIDQDIENADTGSYDIGDAGTFAVSVDGDRLVLDDLNLADGWTITEIDEEADEIEFALANGPRTFDVEVELEDDGTLEIEIDYEVVGPVTR